ncbi:hypothetical protein M3Y94_00299500 [Aphelenchoides besseyi]|nr:hypothetical protein M3Y94_00299500 [Aphelenchoides besseyi]KAI6235844.1 hypothetical protein M3Y95_00094600 [Aphelenchoides besseyi]
MKLLLLFSYIAVLTIVHSEGVVSGTVSFRASRHIAPYSYFTNPKNDQFPLPSNEITDLVNKARRFANEFFTKSELAQLRDRVANARSRGASTAEIRNLVNHFTLLRDERRAAIRAQQQNLRAQFDPLAQQSY